MTDLNYVLNLLKERKEGKNELVPRPYQVEMLEVAKRQDTILFLPTGSGKTYIAMMLILQLSEDLVKPYREGGKRSAFLVNTVALVNQQKEFFQRHLPLKIGGYSGDMNVDYWDKAKWEDELENHQVLVMTAQILLNMLQHGYVLLSRMNLMIFDECHHAVNDHAMRQIMQMFEHTEKKYWPRVLGLTATLLNGNCKPNKVEEELHTLETTYMSKIATCEDMTLVEKFSTSPSERLEYYMEAEVNSMAYQKSLELLEYLTEAINGLVIDPAPPESPVSGAKAFDYKKSDRKKLLGIISDVRIHINTMGLYGGSRACLAHTIQLERLRRRQDEKRMILIYTMMINIITAIRKLFEDEMSDVSGIEQIYKYSSSKLLLLFKILRQNLPEIEKGGQNAEAFKNSLAQRRKKFCSIVFVERRFTAKIISSILQSLRDADPDFSALHPDFIVGYNANPFNVTRELYLESKWNNECLKRFTDGTTNLIVSSDVLEEGIDIPQCNLIIKYDEPKNYRSYVQSKGRARHKDSKYFIMIPHNANKFQLTYETYRCIEAKLQNILIGMQREGPSEENVVTELFDQTETYGVGTSIVSLSSAIALVNRYCSLLPQDKFTVLVPTWFCKEENGKIKVILQLPTNSPLKKPIEGLPYPYLKMAKRSAALEACKLLHQNGLLNNNLLPVLAEEVEDSKLFPLWEEDVEENDANEQETELDSANRPQPRPGTKKKKRVYPRMYSEYLSGCRPVAGTNLYLHVIKMTPKYPYPEDNRRQVFYDLLKAPETFAILCSKKLPKLCQFPIYMNVGEIQVTFLNNASVLQVTIEEVQLLENFNTMIFSQLLKLMKSFLLVDKANLENAFYMVPVKPSNTGTFGTHEIDWSVVRAHQMLPKIQKPSEKELQELHVTKDLFQCALVTPWYRTMLPEQTYVVTRVCHDMNTESPFPAHDYPTYAEYYLRKYNLTILNKEQPLIEVKVISNKINFLRPRTNPARNLTSKRKRQELQEDFEENLVPELCTRYDFPSVLWLKATCLPTIIHRIYYLMLAEEFRRHIVKDLYIGEMDLPDDMHWVPLQYDFTLETEAEEEIRATMGISVSNSVSMRNITQITNISPWGDEKEPIDIDRHLTEVTLVEVVGYDDFISKLPETIENNRMDSLNGVSCYHLNRIHLVYIKILQRSLEDKGPELCDILRALTTSAANDIINMERLETLGDSFLKFSVSLFLYLYYPSDNEGKLTHLKGKIVGNRNLYYCGKHRNLNNIIKVHDFAPTSDWIPPSMCVSRKLQKVIRLADVSPNILYELSIPHEEQISGQMSSATCSAIEQKLLAWDGDAGCHTSMENFLSIQTVSDKCIADCVEAIIGAYLYANGIRGALQIVTWFKILLPEIATAEWMFDEPVPSAAIGSGDIDVHLKCVTELESIIHYTFRDKSFLLQALSHPSYQVNMITECYQRLEYLGDAILDFLITCYIYETCSDLSPGKLTDLRSALVNNVTFAALIVRFGLHKFMLYGSSTLLDVIDRFVQNQEENGHIIDEQILMLVEEEECQIAEAVEVPKALGDLFESLAGAIYLDSGKDLGAVWQVYYPLMMKEIEAFSIDTPINPVRLLYEQCSVAPKFGKSSLVPELERIVVPVSINYNGKCRDFHGFGQTKCQAKRAAAKMAMKYILMNNKNLS